MNNVNVLDCTLRDGGYYNNWEFSSDLVNSYLKTLSQTGVKYVELGFRSFQNNNFKGPNWYTTDSYIKSINIPKNLIIGVMINVSELTSSTLSLKNTIEKLLKSKNKTKISFVRLACRYTELIIAAKACGILKNLGYKVAINLMQISEYNETQIFYACNLVTKANPDILYIADTLGSLDPESTIELIKVIRKSWKGPIGIHAHNNLGQAINNTLAALKTGCIWLDSTIMGMGRGPGNTQTEYLLIQMNNFNSRRIKRKEFNILPLLKFIKKDFRNLKKYYKWGMSPYYYLSGMKSIHPTYVQEMLTMKMSDENMLVAINQLSKTDATKYNSELVKSEFGKDIILIKGTWSPIKTIKSKEVLIVTSGSKMIDYKNEVERYIQVKKPYVIALNTSVVINKNLVDLYVSCNPLKLISDIDSIKIIKSPLAVPHSLLTKDLINKLKNIRLLNYEVGVQSGKYKIFKKGAIVPKLYNISYVLSLATSANASRILLAGFDGYGADDSRTKIIDELFLLYLSSNESKELISVTPTSYSVKSSSIYSLS
jgi:4-hydroxy 2-oxovalerate aldolase